MAKAPAVSSANQTCCKPMPQVVEPGPHTPLSGKVGRTPTLVRNRRRRSHETEREPGHCWVVGFPIVETHLGPGAPRPLWTGSPGFGEREVMRFFRNGRLSSWKLVRIFAIGVASAALLVAASVTESAAASA